MPVIGVIAGLLLLVLLLAFFAGRMYYGRLFRKQAHEILAHARDRSSQRFTYQQIATLPEPVQRYFRFALPDGQPYISSLRLTHGGKFRTAPGKGWVNIKGEQYISSDPPAFAWRGSTALFTAIDSYTGGKGGILVTLFSFLRILKGAGAHYDQGELLRWLAESVWLPTNLLPSEQLTWFPVDDLTARLVFSYRGLQLTYLVSFTEQGEISSFETKRYMGDKGMQTWIGIPSDYRLTHGMRIPFSMEAIYRLPAGDFSYARFRVDTID